MSVDVKIKGLDEVLAHMESISPKIDKELTSTLDSEGISWRDDVRANTPVDSGVLRGAMTFDGVNKTGSGFEMSLVNNTEYAQYVEFGHRTPGGKSTVKGVYMMKNGTVRLEKRLPEALERAMAKALEG